MSHAFYSLTPDRVLSSVEKLGVCTTGLCYTLGSLENRVYEVELVDESRLVAKFYRPDRWSKEAILDEHALLLALQQQDIAVCAPCCFPDKQTLAQTEEGIFVALFPKIGGRSPEELSLGEYEQLGRLLARVHQVALNLKPQHRPLLNIESYGYDALKVIEEADVVPLSLKSAWQSTGHQLLEKMTKLWPSHTAMVPIHGDCHKGNLLRQKEQFCLLDFDDMVIGPMIQDLWLILPARPGDCLAELKAIKKGYEVFATFPLVQLRLIEILRSLRYLHYAAWVTSRFSDPAFERVFSDFKTDMYWQRQLLDLKEQFAWLDYDPLQDFVD